MSNNSALGGDTASLSAFPSVAGILAAEVVAAPIRGTVRVAVALAPAAAGEGVAPVAPGARADGLVVTVVVVARRTLGVYTTRVR